MRSACLVLTGFLALGAPILANAQESANVEFLYKKCKSQEARSQIECSSYLLGISGAMIEIGNLFQNPERIGIDKLQAIPLAPFGVCNTRATAAAVKQVFLNWAEKNPKAWGSRMSSGVMVALAQTWPCGS